MDIQRSVEVVSSGLMELAGEAQSIEFNIPILCLMIFLIAFSGFFSMTETVFSTVNAVRLRIAVEEGKKGAKKALYCAENFDKTLTTLLIGNNIVNISLATISVTFFAGLLVNNANLVDIVSTLVITVIVLIFGEIFPKTLGKKYADTLAMYLGGIIYVFGLILFPLVILFSSLQKSLVSSKEKAEPQVTEDELEAILDTMEDEGVIESEEVEMIQNLLELNDRSVMDIMTPRPDMVIIDISSTIDEIKEMFFKYKYSRIPVFDKDKDNIIGILYEREFLTSLIKHQDFNVKKILKPVKYVSKSMKVNSLIQELQKSQMHIAIVSGEYGETAGLVTMEDALEELVGEIYDEHDDQIESEVMIKKIKSGDYIVNANIYLENLFDELELGKLPETESRKLSGWIYSQCEDVPQEGHSIVYHSTFIKKDEDEEYIDGTYKLTFVINKVEDRRIIEIKLIVEDVKDIDEEVEN